MTLSIDLETLGLTDYLDDETDVQGQVFRHNLVSIDDLQEKAALLDRLHYEGLDEDCLKILQELTKPEVTWDRVSLTLVQSVKALRKSREPAVATLSADLLDRWKHGLKSHKAVQKNLNMQNRAKENGLKSAKAISSSLRFDPEECFIGKIIFKHRDRSAVRSNTGNPKISMFAFPAPTKQSQWAIRIDQCRGGSLHVGCMVTPVTDKGDLEVGSVLGIIGEAYNYRSVAYVIGSYGLVWECDEKGPRSLTDQVKEQIGDVQQGIKLEITDGTGSYSIEASKALSFTEPGSVVIMSLNREKAELTFTVNQSPPFTLTGKLSLQLVSSNIDLISWGMSNLAPYQVWPRICGRLFP
mmetsp:Transcript_38739/g.60419  ORF Transcript_38739/g.60419 Transcript_38739/m.60419 type:complete len:354 (+) Transcript_38739:72-1133(+)